MKQWWNMWNQHESAMKHLFDGRDTPWNMSIQDETFCLMVVKHIESGRIGMKQCVLCSWNILLHGNETPWIRSNNHIDIITAMLITNQIKLFSYTNVLFRVFHGISWCFKVLRSSVSCCFKVFQGASLPCFILSHYHEKDAMGMSL